MTLTTDELEAYVANIDAAGPAHHIPANLLTPPSTGPVFKSVRSVVEETGQEVETFAQGDEQAETADLPDGIAVADLMDRDAWQGQWVGLHEAADMGLLMSLGQPTELGAVAGSANGRVVGDMAYDMIMKSPFLQKVFLRDEMGALKTGMAVIGYVVAVKGTIGQAVEARNAALDLTESEMRQAA